ncbi:MAG: gephyrin-like molybdotransferase Glp [Candidatus Sericytochromatia bacterium]
MIPLSEAQERVLSTLSTSPRSVPLAQAGGLVLAEALFSPEDAPLFDNSAMDGIALRLGNAPLATESGTPLRRRLIGEIPAGQSWSRSLGPDEAVRIMTGAPVPEDADAVVPVEEFSTEADGWIQIHAAVRPGQHIRRRGEEFRSGAMLLPAGTRINPAALGLLAGCGQSEVLVYPRPRVGILATGSELLPVNAPLEPGKLRDSNSYTLAACVEEVGAEAVLYGILPDHPEAIRTPLERAFAECDLVLTSGGVSVGDYDFVQAILLDMGLDKHFWRVAIKPGKPVLFGTLAGKGLFGIPGNPASALAVFEALVRPALRQLLGFQQCFRPQVRGQLQEAVSFSGNRLHLMRVIYAEGRITPLKGQGSAHLLSVAQSNAILPLDKALAAGEQVSVWLTDAD